MRLREANLELVHHGLVIFTWGNVSVIDPETKLVAIKPSGVPYEGMKAQDMVVCDLDGNGYVKIDHNGLTSYPGLYAAGDVTVSDLKQVITAASGGASAAFEALRYIDDRLCQIG